MGRAAGDQWKNRRRRRRRKVWGACSASGGGPSSLLVVVVVTLAAGLLALATAARAAYVSAASIGGVRWVVEAIVEQEDDRPAAAAQEEVLIGWKGETWQPAVDPVAATAADGGGSGGESGNNNKNGDTQQGSSSSSSSEDQQQHRQKQQQIRDQAGSAATTAATTAATAAGSNSNSNATAPAAPTTPWVELLSWRPRAFLYHGFLSDAECDHIVRLAEGRVIRSGVVDNKTGKTKLDPIRTSTGAALSRGQDATIAEVERRAAEWTRVPPDHAEAMQVLRYENGQTYKAHWDWFDDPVHTQQAKTVGNRVATVLLYLSDVDEGGATTLPLAFPANATRAREAFNPDPSAGRQCAGEQPGMGIAVRPRKGDALLFFDMLPDGKTVDRRSLHASCPTVRGVKWTSTLWIRAKRYGEGKYDPLERSGRCEDLDARCAAWAAERPVSRCDGAEAGRLTGLRGVCRRACRDCAVCARDDVLCLRANGRSRRAELLAWDEEQRRAPGNERER